MSLSPFESIHEINDYSDKINASDENLSKVSSELKAINLTYEKLLNEKKTYFEVQLENEFYQMARLLFPKCGSQPPEKRNSGSGSNKNKSKRQTGSVRMV